jgi:hypothetical protein
MSDIQKDERTNAHKASLRTSVPQSVQNLISTDYRAYVVKKSERLASALYVVTGFIHSDEPIRRKLRTGALDLIGLSTRPSGLSLEGIEKFKSLCVEMGVLLTTARGAGLLSEMNAGLLAEEYALLGAFISENSQTIREGSVLAFEELETPRMALTEPIRESSYKKSAPEKKSERKETHTKRAGDQTDRRKTILDLVDVRGSISIKDAVSLIPGVSEKTIQRELLAMVKDGSLLKEGERRWSTYKRAPAGLVPPKGLS